MWELDHKEGWALKNWCLQTVVLEKTLESLLDRKEIQPVHPKVLNIHWKDWCWSWSSNTLATRADSVFAKSWLVRKDPDSGKGWRWEEKGMTEDEMVGWHHRPSRHGFGWTPGVGDGQGGLACYSSRGHKESDMTEWTTITTTKTVLGFF